MLPSSPSRETLAAKRLLSVLRIHTVACARTLEQKISDAGPNNQRIEPHVLTRARNKLIQEGVIAKATEITPWYYLATTPARDVNAKLELLRPVHEALQAQSFVTRVGQTLEIAVYRALLQSDALNTLGCFLDLSEHEDDRLYKKEEPPANISNKRCTGKLDFVVLGHTGLIGGLEVKNVREWLYPNRDEVRGLLAKCTSLDVVPVLISRRFPYVTFRLLNSCGVIVHQTYNQLFPMSEPRLATQARDKRLLGYHDVRLGNSPDARLLKFLREHLPNLLLAQRPTFDKFKDLLQDFSSGSMLYAEFAARVRRRVKGTNEEGDWPDEEEREDE